MIQIFLRFLNMSSIPNLQGPAPREKQHVTVVQHDMGLHFFLQKPLHPTGSGGGLAGFKLQTIGNHFTISRERERERIDFAEDDKKLK